MILVNLFPSILEQEAWALEQQRRENVEEIGIEDDDDCDDDALVDEDDYDDDEGSLAAGSSFDSLPNDVVPKLSPKEDPSTFDTLPLGDLSSPGTKRDERIDMEAVNSRIQYLRHLG